MKKKKSLPKLKADLQNIFNEFIRLRDAGKPCISCGQIKLLQAGHYFTVKKNDALRFDEENCHGECAGCNGFNKDHLVGYTWNLIDKIGRDKYNKLFERKDYYKLNTGFKWMRYEIEEKIVYYKAEVKQLKTQ